jgi:hypothetical protein
MGCLARSNRDGLKAGFTGIRMSEQTLIQAQAGFVRVRARCLAAGLQVIGSRGGLARLITTAPAPRLLRATARRARCLVGCYPLSRLDVNGMKSVLSPLEVKADRIYNAVSAGQRIRD